MHVWVGALPHGRHTQVRRQRPGPGDTLTLLLPPPASQVLPGSPSCWRAPLPAGHRALLVLAAHAPGAWPAPGPQAPRPPRLPVLSAGSPAPQPTPPPETIPNRAPLPVTTSRSPGRQPFCPLQREYLPSNKDRKLWEPSQEGP